MKLDNARPKIMQLASQHKHGGKHGKGPFWLLCLSPDWPIATRDNNSLLYYIKNNLIYSVICSFMGKTEPTKKTWLPMCGFKAQLEEQRVTGSNPVEALIFFFRLLLPNCSSH